MFKRRVMNSIVPAPWKSVVPLRHHASAIHVCSESRMLPTSGTCMLNMGLTHLPGPLLPFCSYLSLGGSGSFFFCFCPHLSDFCIKTLASLNCVGSLSWLCCLQETVKLFPNGGKSQLLPLLLVS